MPQRKRLPRKTLDERIDERRVQLGLAWSELEERVGVTKKTMLNIRNGGASYPKTIRNLEAVLGWTIGSIATIKNGGEPTLKTDPLAAGPSTPQSGDEDDPVIQLRAVRQRMGATSFWREVAIMQSEEATLSSTPQAL